MAVMAESQLKSGTIFGDTDTQEYVYMPASEIGAATPLFVIETVDSRQDISLAEALSLIRRLSLKPVRHPRLGLSSC